MKDEWMMCVGGPMDGKKIRVPVGAHDVRVPRLSKIRPVETVDDLGGALFEFDLYFVTQFGSKKFLQYEGMSAAEAMDCLLEAYGPPESEIEGGIVPIAYMLAKSLLNQMESRYSHLELLGRLRDLDPVRFDRATNTTDLTPKTGERVKESKLPDAGRALRAFKEEFGSNFEPEFKLAFPLPPKEGTTTVKGDVGSKSK